MKSMIFTTLILTTFSSASFAQDHFFVQGKALGLHASAANSFDCQGAENETIISQLLEEIKHLADQDASKNCIDLGYSRADRSSGFILNQVCKIFGSRIKVQAMAMYECR